MTAQLPSRERLEKIASWRETYGAGHNVMLPAEEAEALARFALAAHEQEPVAANDATETLQKICNIFRIGIQAQTQSTILTNVENAVRFAEHLHAIEREFFMVPGEPDEDYPDDEPEDVCLVNSWGSTTERYVEQFREALARVTHPAPSIPAAVPEDFEVWAKDVGLIHESFGLRSVNSNIDVARKAYEAGRNSPVIHDGYVLMPVKLTAENGAKYALSGEFHVLHRVTCHECGGEGCSDCDDDGWLEEKIMIGWDDIKDIYRTAVEACSIKSTVEGV